MFKKALLLPINDLNNSILTSKLKADYCFVAYTGKLLFPEEFHSRFSCPMLFVDIHESLDALQILRLTLELKVIGSWVSIPCEDLLEYIGKRFPKLLIK